MATHSPANADPIQLDDRLVRLLFAPVLGIAIAGLTGLYDGIRPGLPLFWVATVYFILVSCLIWQGNRFLWAKMRGRPDWLEHPLLRVFLLGTASVSFTIVTCVALLMVWQRIEGLARPNWRSIEVSTLVTVVSVTFIVHTYETVYLIRQRRQDQVQRESLERDRARAEVAALKAQIDPHFVFNSLNNLVELTEADPERATEFTLRLADVYRYVVANRNRELIPLMEEIQFLESYRALLGLRFGRSILLQLPTLSTRAQHYLIPPVSLQLLLENAVRHNQFCDEKPLRVVVELGERMIVVSNETRPLAVATPGAQTGLRNLEERCRLSAGRGIAIREERGRYLVEVPLV